jgi:hypothetical protein
MSISQCGGSGQRRIECIIRACQYNMTDECFNAMLEPTDYPSYAPLLAKVCELGQSTGLNIPLSNNCRRVCRMDRDACRERRKLYCASRGDLDPRGDDLCACYQTRSRYSRTVADAVSQLAVSNIEQLRYIQDLVQTNILTPSCWYGPCTTSTYGSDTEITVPCQDIGLCVQAIEGTGGITAPVINLTNSCTITSGNVSTLDAKNISTQQNINVQAATTQDNTLNQQDVVTPASVITLLTFDYTWIYVLSGIVVILLIVLLIYLIVRYYRNSSSVKVQAVSKR